MALDMATKYKIVVLLGFPSGVITVGNVNYSNTIVSNLAALPEELEEMVQAKLTRLDSLETSLTNELARAGVKSIDDIELNGDGMMHLRSEKRRILRELGAIFDLPMQSCESMGNIFV